MTRSSQTKTLHFTIDAKLLRELGERLVGRPHIALGELIKNSYDADANNVEIVFTGDRILVADDGHGMNAEAFTDRWMRIGTTEKEEQQVSPRLGRPLTGSKGVGRLSAQLLAGNMVLRSTASSDIAFELQAEVNWPIALEKDELSEVEVQFRSGPATGHYAAGSPHGTVIELTDLTFEWDAISFELLAREIWALQPPFSDGRNQANDFKITLRTSFPDVQERFDKQMSALMSVANATITGRLVETDEEISDTDGNLLLNVGETGIDEDGEIDHAEAISPAPEPKVQPFPSRSALITVHIQGGDEFRYLVQIPDCRIEEFEFEIRVFDLRNRQPAGITVGVAREYLAQFGGVHIYDNGFRLPYYGADTDWLRLELDHARRISRSQLLPPELQSRNAMQDLPSNKRVFGVVNVSTSREAQDAASSGRKSTDALSIQITRDRLTDNLPYQQLRRTVRLGVDLYAAARSKAKARNVLKPARRSTTTPSAAVREMSATVEAVKETIPEQSYVSLRDAVSELSDDLQSREREARTYASVLGSLATAGMTSLAYEHEISHQLEIVSNASDRLESIANGQGLTEAARSELKSISERLRLWADRAGRLHALFAPLLNEEDRTLVDPLKARALIEDVSTGLEVVARGAEVDASGVPANMMLPPATLTAWSAVVQNILVNAYRATLEENPGLIYVDGGTSGSRSWLRFQDNGTGGIDIADSSRLFLPFERDAKVSERAEILGLGGSGLGLAIVKMVTDETGCLVKFVKPDPGWSTALQIEWKHA